MCPDKAATSPDFTQAGVASGCACDAATILRTAIFDFFNNMKYFGKCVFACLLWVQMSLGNAQDKPATLVTVAAASDLKFAMEEVAAQYEKSTGQKITLVFGSSGQFSAQILQGAPFDIFMSADEAYIYKLADAGKTRDKGRLYAIGRIGVFVPLGSALKADGSLKDLSAALQDGRLHKLSIANPEHAPYGERAKQALQATGLWNAVQGKLVLGENISQAAQFTLSGSAQIGIIAQSLAMAPVLADKGKFELIDQKWHQPLLQRMVLLKPASVNASAFYDYLGGKAAQSVLMRYGFTLS